MPYKKCHYCGADFEYKKFQGLNLAKYCSDRCRIKANIKINSKTNCWEWQSSKLNFGYGTYGSKLVHRLSYQAFKGEIPKGLVLDHLCKNPCCVNPEHLEPVTTRENLLRGNTFQAQKHAQVFCIHGHPLSGKNLYITPDNRRQCKTCNALRQYKSQLKKKGA